MKILLTGAAGFVGFHVAQYLLGRGDEVLGLDNINDYYDPALKYGRLAELGIAEADVAWGQAVASQRHANFRFLRMDLADREGMAELFAKEGFEVVCHLAAQAGVRYSIQNPHAYIESNIVGFMNILEGCRHHKVKHLVYASSSSVYGANKKIPFATSDNVDYPVSLYAATKKSNELMAHTYSHLYGLPSTGLRFFTVYGPWGRPDMAYYLFTEAITKGKPIKVFNHGDMSRDFTYIDDIVEGVVRVMDHAPEASTAADAPTQAPYAVYNIGNNEPVRLGDFIATLETLLGQEALKDMLPMQMGDVPRTFADVDDLREKFGYKPDTSITEGLGKFVAWYRDYTSEA